MEIIFPLIEKFKKHLKYLNIFYDTVAKYILLNFVSLLKTKDTSVILYNKTVILNFLMNIKCFKVTANL